MKTENELIITILTENSVSLKEAHNCQAEWGLSLLMEWKGKKFLLDSGATNLYMRNAEKMKINLDDIDGILLSHYHWDHVDGLNFLETKEKKSLFCHPESISKLPEKQQTLFKSKFNITSTEIPLEIHGDMFLMGENPRITEIERGTYKENPMKDDSAMVFKTEKGCVIVTGCSHSGIINICLQAMKISGQKLHAVIGGFHLFKENMETTEKVISWFEDHKIEILYPMHCIDFPTLSFMNTRLTFEKTATGDIIRI